MKLRLFQDDKLKEEHIDVHYRVMTPKIEKVIEVLEGDQVRLHLYGKTEKNEQILIRISDIYYFEYVDKRTFAYLKKEVYQVQESLAKLEVELAQEGFVRINKSNLVNIYHIHSIKPEVNMRVKAIMENKECLIINRSYKSRFQQYLKERRNVL